MDNKKYPIQGDPTPFEEIYDRFLAKLLMICIWNGHRKILKKICITS